MNATIENINTTIEEAYLKVYKQILNMNETPKTNEAPISIDLLQDTLKSANPVINQKISALEKEKVELTQEIKALNEQNSKIIKILSSLNKELKNTELIIEDSFANMDWDKCKKFVVAKKFPLFLLIPIMTILFNRILSEEEIVGIFKQKNFPACVAVKELKFNIELYDGIKQHFTVAKIPSDEMGLYLTTLNQQINKYFEAKKRQESLDVERHENRSKCSAKEIQQKVCNDLFAFYKSQYDDKTVEIVNKLSSLVVDYNKSISVNIGDDLVPVYYQRMMDTIEKDRDALLTLESRRLEESRNVSAVKVTIDHHEITQPKKKGFFSLFGCC